MAALSGTPADDQLDGLAILDGAELGECAYIVARVEKAAVRRSLDSHGVEAERHTWRVDHIEALLDPGAMLQVQQLLERRRADRAGVTPLPLGGAA